MSIAESQTVHRRRMGFRLHNDDAALVRHAQAGDERAFAAIFERHHAPLLAYCRHMLGNRDDGEDALQQAFIRAHQALLRGTAPRELRPWLYAIARNCCLSAIAARRPTAPLEDRAPALAGLSDEVHQREDLRQLLDGIGRLPEDQRSALLLAELDDLNHRAIATVVGCPVSKVKALIYQARSALIAERDARETPCQEIREQLAVARGGELRRGPLRRHLNLCAGCRDFQVAVGAQRQSLAALLPVAPSAGLMTAVLGHGSAHLAGAAGLGGGGAASASTGVAGSSAGAGMSGATVTGATATGSTATGGGIALSGTAAAGTAGGAGAGAGAGTGVGALVGGGLVTKLAVGGAVVALAAAGTVAVRQRPARATFSSHVLVPSAHHGSGMGAAKEVVEGTDRAPLPIAGAGEAQLVGSNPESSVTPIAANEPAGSPSSVDPFTEPMSGAGAPTLVTFATSSPPSALSGALSGASTTKSGQSAVSERSLAKSRRARANLRRAALRRHALRLREARRRARLRKARRHRRHAAKTKPLKSPKPPAPTPTVTPTWQRVHRRAHPAPAPSSTPSETIATGEGKKAKRQSPPAAGTSPASKNAKGSDPETSSTGNGKTKMGSGGGEETSGSSTGTGKSGAGGKSGGVGEKSGSNSGAGDAGPGAGTERSGSDSGTGKTGSGPAQDKSSSGAAGKETGSGGKGSQTGTGAGTGSGSTTGTGAPTETGSGDGHTNEKTGAGKKGSEATPKKDLLEEGQLPNL